MSRDLGQHHTGGHRGIQRLRRPSHRDGHHGIAVLPHQPRQSLALGTDHDDHGPGAVELVDGGVTIGVEADHLQAGVGPAPQTASAEAPDAAGLLAELEPNEIRDAAESLGYPPEAARALSEARSETP